MTVAARLEGAPGPPLPPAGGTARARVVHVITKLEWGGAQENTLLTVGALDAARFDAVLVAGPGGMLDARAAALPGVRFLTVPSLVREIRPAADVRAFRALTGLLADERRGARGLPVIVHTHSSKAGILGRAAARAAGVDAVVHSIHGFGFHDGQPAPLRRLLVGAERAAARWTDAFVAVSEENVRLGAAEGVVDPARCRLIRSGFDTAAFRPGDPSPGRALAAVPPGARVVGTVAVFKPQKAPLDFVAVARRVAAEVPDAFFVMVGDGELRPAAERAAAEASLAGRFSFTGFRPEVPDLLRAFDVFLLTSRWEGLPKVVPQALLSGVPVVATAVDGTREIVDDGVDGYLLEPGDLSGLAGRVAALLKGESRLDPSAKRERLVREFDATAMVRAQERLYGELLSARGFRGWGP